MTGGQQGAERAGRASARRGVCSDCGGAARSPAATQPPRRHADDTFTRAGKVLGKHRAVWPERKRGRGGERRGESCKESQRVGLCVRGGGLMAESVMGDPIETATEGEKEKGTDDGRLTSGGKEERRGVGGKGRSRRGLPAGRVAAREGDSHAPARSPEDSSGRFQDAAADDASCHHATCNAQGRAVSAGEGHRNNTITLLT